jgi:hypothetical protein
MRLCWHAFCLRFLQWKHTRRSSGMSKVFSTEETSQSSRFYCCIPTLSRNTINIQYFENVLRVEDILRCFNTDQSTSTRRFSRTFRVLRITIFRTLHSGQRHPCHFTPVHDLLPPDREHRLRFVTAWSGTPDTFCLWFLCRVADEPQFLGRFCGQMKPHSSAVA